jgi:two-component system, CAI-1 autoinducer sensor kinase/phosphatase CqsS
MVVPRESMRDMLERSRFAIRWGGALGLLCHPIYYVIWTYVLPQPYDNLLLRLSAAAVCVPLLFQSHWPKRFNHFLLIYWHCCLIYVLPFVCTFLTIRNGFSTMWMMTEVMMIFIMALCIDNPLLLMACIGIGMFSGTVAAVATTPAPIILDAATQSNLALLPVVVLCSMAFSHAISKGRIFVEKNRALQALAGSIAHEMRNPLSQLRHVLDRVEEALPATTGSTQSTALSPAKSAELYQHVAHGQLSIERGLRIIAMTLDEVGDKSIHSEHLTYLSAADTTRKALDEYGFDNEKERSKVKLVVQEDFIFKVDETVYLFTLFNLIKNSLHHIATLPLATLTLKIDRQSVIVMDTGTGVKPEILQHLFEPFRTAGNSAGTGLGLAYCQRAMQAFGGSISCRSEVGKFTEFTLQFPAVPEQEVAGHEHRILERATPFFKEKRVLIVDDEASHRTRTCRALSRVGAQVASAESGARALAMLQQSTAYDLVLMDINMPGLDGYATAEKIRANRRYPNWDVLIVAYTAEPGNAARVHARRAGMDDMVSKSSGVLELITSLQTLLENGEERHQSQRSDGLAGKSILVADDDTYSRLVAKASLERYGATVIEAEHGQAVLTRLQEENFVDAIVMDMNMPGMSGAETTAAIRARTDAYAGIPIIALTSQSDNDSVQACLAIGMNEVMIKPVHGDSLYDCVARQFTQPPKSNQPANANLPQASITPVERPVPIAESAPSESLLDERHLEELIALDLMDEPFLNGIEQIRVLVTRIAADAAANDLESTHNALHLLLGISGNIGAKALHQFARQVYPPFIAKKWPVQTDWVARINGLGTRSADALHRYYVETKALQDHRDALSNSSAPPY